MLIGVLSDTHGTLHPHLVPTFKAAGIELILHAGDVGDSAILRELETLAPVRAVRGNVDLLGEVGDLPLEIDTIFAGVRVYMAHVGRPPKAWAARLALPPPDVVIYGHSHIALCERVGKTLFLNPGAAGTRPRFGGGLSAALLRIEGSKAEAEIIILQVGKQ
jgi:putative phosphoesterase